MTSRDGITRVFIARRRPDLSIEQFQRHWRNEHATITLTFPSLNRYVQNHAVLRDGVPLLQSPDIDVFSELDFDSADAMDASWSSPEYAVGEEDENNFIDPRWSTVLVGVRLRLGEPAPPRFQLTWLCAGVTGVESPGRQLDVDTIRSVAERLLPATRAAAVAAIVATPELAARYRPRDYGAIVSVGFDDLDRVGPILRSVLDVVVADLGRHEHDGVVLVEPNIVIGSEA